uniref:Uncharacterized protein n=1 Tax=Phenylobacterium glaciei TaxID=2803784 RepID=A0A974P144_9CAUL|nr:hypothetical protein JKL49_19360 [Phenylobacterium glaciei]
MLTLFEAGKLHRFEVITATAPDKTLGRYQAREGAGFYMGFCEASDMGAIERACAAHGAGITIDRPEARPPALNSDQLWLHPQPRRHDAGVSRPTMAWNWSGHPERVERIDA